MKLLKYLLLIFLILFENNIAYGKTCCWRNIITDIEVPSELSSKNINLAWDVVFTKREYGGGPLLDCPLIDVLEPEALTPITPDPDYIFRGRITANQTIRGTNHFTLTVQLVDKCRK